MKYWAFISYSHTDKEWGDWLHKALETYRVPSRLVGKESRDGTIPSRIFPVFRDREELPVSSDLGTNISEALRESRYLIVVCSPRSARSRWVGEEIKAFKSLGLEDRILALIVDGEPNAADGKPGFTPEDECFHEALRYRWSESGEATAIPTEPIAADAREGKDGRNNAKLKLLAGLLGVNYDDLKQRDHERRLRRARRIGIAAFALVVVFAGLAVWAILAAREAARQKTQTQKLLVATDSARAQELFERGDAATALAFLARAAEQDPDDRSVAAERLWFALTQRSWPMPLNSPMRHTEAISSACFSPDGTRVLTAGRDLTAHLWKASSGEPVGTSLIHPRPVRRALFSLDGRRVITVCLDGVVRVSNLEGDNFGRPSQLKNPDSINAVAVSAKGTYVATGSVDGAVRFWNVASGQMVGEIKVAENVHTLVFHPSDETQLLGVSGKTAILWKVPEGAAVFQIEHGADINSAEFDFEGHRILTASNDHIARVSDGATGDPSGIELMHDAPVVNAKFSWNGQLAATISGTKVWVWELRDHGIRKHELAHEAVITSVQFSHDSLVLFTAAADGRVREWNLISGRRVGEAIIEESGIVAMDLDPLRDKLLLGTANGTARVWRPPPRYPASDRLVHGSPIEAMDLSPDGALLATGTDDGRGYLWDLGRTEKPQSSLPHKAAVLSVVFSPDGSFILTGGADATARIWQTKSGEAVGAALPHAATVSQVAFRGDGKVFTTATETGVAQLWDMVSRERIGDSMRHEPHISGIEFSRDGKLLVTAGWDGKVRQWNAASAESVGAVFGTEHEVTCMRLAPDNNAIATGHRNGAVNLWSLSGKLLQRMSHKKAITSLAFTRTGQYLVTGSEDYTASVWDVATGRPAGEPIRHEAPVTAVAFDPASDRVATAADDGTVRVWDALTGQPITETLRHEKGVTCLEFSHDGKTLFSASRDRTVRIWDVSAKLTAGDRKALVRLAREISPVALQSSGRTALRTIEPLAALQPADHEGQGAAAVLRKWFFADVLERPISPFAALNLRSFIRNRREENSPAATEEALFWQNGEVPR
ncbi:MAG: TIR domain-containing protein [Verrucomicrobiota bacterium]|nr:TIR domain-containing protein [Verrucomicrobiota bacterium]